MTDRLTEEFKTVEEFLEKLYTFQGSTEAKDKMAGVDLVYAVVFTILDDLPMKMIDDIMEKTGAPRVLGTDDESAKNAKFETMDKILRGADPKRLSDTLSLALLSTTLGCKDRLQERAFYLERCRRRYLETGNKGRAKRLLNGLS